MLMDFSGFRHASKQDVFGGKILHEGYSLRTWGESNVVSGPWVTFSYFCGLCSRGMKS
jgi:hypothetical protein